MSVAHPRKRPVFGGLAVLAFLAGCLPAVHMDGRALKGPTLAFEPPPGWHLRRNYRFFGSSYVEMATPDGQGSITVELMRASHAFSGYPLDLLAECIVGDRERGFGIVTTAEMENEIEIAGHRAVALTGNRVHGPQVVDYTSIVARTDHRLLVIMAHAPKGRIGSYAMDLERIIETLDLPKDPPPPSRIEDP